MGFADKNVTDMKVTLDDSQHLFVSVYLEGLYETVDSGHTWQQHHVNSRINEIAISPVTNKTLYLATMSSGGLYRTVDGGQYWEPIPDSPSLPYNLLSISIHPTDPNILFVGAQQWESGQGRLFKTINKGETWHALPDFTALDIVFNPITAHIMYAGTTNGVIKSTNAGETWLPANSGLPVDNPKDIFEIILHPNNADHLYAATENGIYTSFDATDSWKPLLTGTETRSIIFHPSNSKTLFTGTQQGIHVSHNNGASWYLLTGCLDNVHINKLMFDLIDPTLLWIGTNNGLWSCHLE